MAEDTMSENEAEAAGASLAQMFASFQEEFHQLRANRFKANQEEYGALTFLGNDIVRMMMQELADTANYCEMQFCKLMMLQTALEEELTGKVSDNGDITIGLQSFKGTKDGWE